MMYGDKPCSKNTCEECGGRLTKTFEDSDVLFCSPCLTEVEQDVATSGWFNLLITAFVFVFNFEFRYAFGAFWYSMEALFGIGDFNPKTGRFYKRGYLKSK